MRVICLVPSLTETLIECGVEVVGRTRFCIHPAAQVRSIPIVGGTKSVNWDKCLTLNADIVVFDREENTQEMATACPLAWYATHINSVDSIGEELHKLAEQLGNPSLAKMADQWTLLCKKESAPKPDWSNVPGMLENLGNTENTYSRVQYIIWRDPWMAVGQQTFIGSMLEHFDFDDCLSKSEKNYPELSEAQMAKSNTFYLFSSEPYPFLKHKQRLIDHGFNGAIVDGEVYSWFGIRSYRALSEYLN